MRKARKTNAVLMVNGEVGKPCTNSKFMHIAGLPGMTLKTSYDTHYNEETTSVYMGEDLMAERIMQCIHFLVNVLRLIVIFLATIKVL
ncbi:hypothetical protein ALHIDCOG_00432 [Klebsiella phage CPRSB]|nr:hypothetical protein ALHIDCOG_00432 [Klebsiella phage CPRSB]